MEYTEVTISTTTRGSEIVSDILLRLGAAGTQILDRADLPDPNKPTANWELMDQSVIDAMPEDVQVKAWYPEEEAPVIAEKLTARLAALRERSAADPGTLKVSLVQAENIDWAENWKKYYHAFRAGKRLVIKPTWETWDRQEGDLVVEMDPGMAFGTGTHQTPALCVEMIEAYYRGGSFLDVGTGSGILAICACLLGADSVTAVDIDPDAVQTARENAASNGLQDRIDVREGDLLKGLDRRFDFAVANILAPIVCVLCGPLFAQMNPGARFVCSGILAEQEDTVRDALEKSGWRILEVRRKKDWVAFASDRP